MKRPPLVNLDYALPRLEAKQLLLAILSGIRQNQQYRLPILDNHYPKRPFLLSEAKND